eukprot:scaffold12731_cov100-Isochrysis_galbana.AAC.1
MAPPALEGGAEAAASPTHGEGRARAAEEKPPALIETIAVSSTRKTEWPANRNGGGESGCVVALHMRWGGGGGSTHLREGGVAEHTMGRAGTLSLGSGWWAGAERPGHTPTRRHVRPSSPTTSRAPAPIHPRACDDSDGFEPRDEKEIVALQEANRACRKGGWRALWAGTDGARAGRLCGSEPGGYNGDWCLPRCGAAPSSATAPNEYVSGVSRVESAAIRA